MASLSYMYEGVTQRVAAVHGWPHCKWRLRTQLPSLQVRPLDGAVAYGEHSGEEGTTNNNTSKMLFYNYY